MLFTSCPNTQDADGEGVVEGENVGDAVGDGDTEVDASALAPASVDDAAVDDGVEVGDKLVEPDCVGVRVCDGEADTDTDVDCDADGQRLDVAAANVYTETAEPVPLNTEFTVLPSEHENGPMVMKPEKVPKVLPSVP